MDVSTKHSDRPWSLFIALITVLISLGGAYLTADWSARLTVKEETQKEVDQGQVILNNIVFRYSMSLSELVDKNNASKFFNATAEHVYVENLKQIKRDIQWLYENQISINIKHSIVQLIFTEMIITKEIYDLENDPMRDKPDYEVLKSVCKLLDKGILTSSAGDNDTSAVINNASQICQANESASAE